MKSVIAILHDQDFTMKEFWEAINELPAEFDGKPMRANISGYFKKDGTPKVRQRKGQQWHDTQKFIRKNVRTHMHVKKLKKHREQLNEAIQYK